MIFAPRHLRDLIRWCGRSMRPGEERQGQPGPPRRRMQRGSEDGRRSSKGTSPESSYLKRSSVPYPRGRVAQRLQRASRRRHHSGAVKSKRNYRTVRVQEGRDAEKGTARPSTPTWERSCRQEVISGFRPGEKCGRFFFFFLLPFNRLRRLTSAKWAYKSCRSAKQLRGREKVTNPGRRAKKYPFIDATTWWGELGARRSQREQAPWTGIPEESERGKPPRPCTRDLTRRDGSVTRPRPSTRLAPCGEERTNALDEVKSRSSSR